MDSSRLSKEMEDKIVCYFIVFSFFLFSIVMSGGLIRYILAPSFVEDYSDPCNATGIISMKALRELQKEEAKVLTLISLAENDTTIRDSGIKEAAILEFLRESIDILKERSKMFPSQINEQISHRRSCAGANIRKHWNYLFARSVGIPLCFLILGLLMLSYMIWNCTKLNDNVLLFGPFVILLGFAVTGFWLQDIIFLIDFHEKNLDFSMKFR